jgi:hypothetical protein
MRGLKFSGGDWVLNKMVTDDEQLAQNLEHLFLTRIGEWFLDLDHGFRKNVLETKKANDRDITQAIYETAYQEPRVKSVIDIVFQKDAAKRWLNVQFKVEKIDGGTVGVDTNVNI